MWEIYGTINGERKYLFSWTRSKETGIARAYKDAPMFNVEVTDVDAVWLPNTELN